MDSTLPHSQKERKTNEKNYLVMGLFVLNANRNNYIFGMTIPKLGKTRRKMQAKIKGWYHAAEEDEGKYLSFLVIRVSE